MWDEVRHASYGLHYHRTSQAILGEPGPDALPLGEAITYTMDGLHTIEGSTPVGYYEWRILILAAFEQARQDVVVGITDSSVSEGQRTMRRADALMFFLDGRWESLMDFCGVETKAMPEGIPGWVRAMGQWSRNMPGCSPVATDVEAIFWANSEKHLDLAENWEAASTAANGVKKTVRRLRVGHLDSGYDNLERQERDKRKT